MSCVDWEERVALYAGGDLPAGEAAELERHLSGCAACREALESQGRALALLREAHAALLPASAYTAVRARVLERLERRPSPVWRRVWVGVGAMAVVALVFVAIPRRVQTPVKQTVVEPRVGGRSSRPSRGDRSLTGRPLGPALDSSGRAIATQSRDP